MAANSKQEQFSAFDVDGEKHAQQYPHPCSVPVPHLVIYQDLINALLSDHDEEKTRILGALPDLLDDLRGKPHQQRLTIWRDSVAPTTIAVLRAALLEMPPFLDLDGGNNRLESYSDILAIGYREEGCLSLQRKAIAAMRCLFVLQVRDLGQDEANRTLARISDTLADVCTDLAVWRSLAKHTKTFDALLQRQKKATKRATKYDAADKAKWSALFWALRRETPQISLADAVKEIASREQAAPQTKASIDKFLRDSLHHEISGFPDEDKKRLLALKTKIQTEQPKIKQKDLAARLASAMQWPPDMILSLKIFLRKNSETL